MREIKFRFWDGKKMYYQNYPDATIWNALLVCEGDTIPLEYTGIKDKGGVDIYEGDIVKGWGTGVIEYGLHGYEGGYESMGFYIKDRNGEPDETWDLRWGKDLEVVGNKYENPELLKQEQICQ